jgi:hypothetical protein
METRYNTIGIVGAGARSIDRARWALQAADQDFVDPAPVIRSAAEASSTTRTFAAEPRADSRDNTWEREMTVEQLHRYSRPRGGLRDYLLAAFAAIVVAQMGYIAYLVYVKAPAIVVEAPKITSLSTAGLAPADVHTPPQALPLTLQPLVAEPRQRELPVPSAEPVRSGGVRLVSPLELQVLEGDRVLGSTADGPIVASAGRHEFEFVNSALGYRGRRIVNLKAGAVVSLSLPHPEGTISINAIPWADVWIDNNHVGETPLANLSIPIGENEVSFRHPSLGVHRRTAIVRFDAPARVSADLR